MTQSTLGEYGVEIDRDDGVEDDRDDDWEESAEPFDAEERGRIGHHAARDNMDSLLRTIGADRRMDQAGLFREEGIETARDLFDHYDDVGHFEAVEGVGPTTSARIEDAVPLIRKAVGDR